MSNEITDKHCDANSAKVDSIVCQESLFDVIIVDEFPAMYASGLSNKVVCRNNSVVLALVLWASMYN